MLSYLPNSAWKVSVPLSFINYRHASHKLEHQQADDVTVTIPQLPAMRRQPNYDCQGGTFGFQLVPERVGFDH